MRTLLGAVFFVPLVALAAPAAQAHDRGGKSEVSFGIVITGGDGHHGRAGRHHWYDPYDGHGYGRHHFRGRALHGCHVERRFGYHHGRRAEFGRTVCYDRFGRRVVLAGSSYIVRYRGHF